MDEQKNKDNVLTKKDHECAQMHPVLYQRAHDIWFEFVETMNHSQIQFGLTINLNRQVQFDLACNLRPGSK